MPTLRIDSEEGTIADNEGMGIRMGRYVNPDNEGFAEILQGKYVDKTGLISVFDSTLNVAGQKLVMVSRPRRFGKSYAAHALAALPSSRPASDATPR